MKQLLVLIILAATHIANGQAAKQYDSLILLNNKYKTPIGCTAKTSYQLKCDNYSIQWFYMSDGIMKMLPDTIVSQLERQKQAFHKEMINPYILDQVMKGYKISYESEGSMHYQIIAYGIVNEQPILVQLSLDNEPKNNDDIPEFARQIIKLTH